MNNPFSLEGKTILVTGASSGIGRQCAIDCAMMGAKVILVARNAERLQETLNMMEGEGHLVIPADLSSVENISQLVKQAVSQCGMVSGVVNCAGISSVLPLKLVKEEVLDQMIHANVYSAYFLTKEICRMGNHDKSGASIIFLSSVMGISGENAKSMYGLTKGALISAARSLSIEFAPKNIRVNCIAPGVIETPINRSQPYLADPDKRKVLESKYPLGLGRTTDVSYACIYLLSDASRWITGQNIVIDGGYTAL